MENHSQYHGSVIAFEGPETLVSTQLRLLPISPQLLILPSLQHYMEEDSNTPFDSRSCIKDVHQAALARHEAALQFLNGSSSNNKKLVFLNGGTAAAVSQCISVISERQASGDIILAEAIYKNIAGEGVRGLDLQGKYANREALDKLNSERDLDEALWEDDNEDPITKAMRAADALYRETESLQPVDCYIRTRSRSLSLPMFDYANDLGQVSPFFVFGSSPSEGAPSVFGGEDEEEAHTAVAEKDPNGGPNLKKFPGGQRLRISVPHRSASSMAEAVHGRNVEHRSTIQLFSSAAGGFMSPPITPEGVVYGEARLVQMQASKSQGLRKIRSLDDMELTEARRRRISIQMPAAQRASPIDSPDPKSRHLSIVEDPYSPNNLVHLPLAKFVKARTTTIRKSPTFWKALPQPARQTYVHQGTDVADFGRDNADLDTEFEPVLPLYEDLVVHFTSFSPDYVLDSVIQSFKNGLYPILGNTSESFGGTAETDSCPSTPRTADLFDLEDSKGDGLSPVAEVPSADEASDYDPYAARASDVRCGHKMALQQSSTPPPHAQQPPAPAQAHEQHVDAKFHEFPTAGRLNAIVTQNELRSVLEQYFPHQESVGYLQFNSSLLPDMNELWRPIFQGFEAQGSTSAQHTADLILAIGCQKGVKSEFVSALTGQVEKLGTKSNGASRNGRLDIRYLIATAMQSSSTQRLTSLSDNTFSDSPYALACLLIPHLETYLAANTATRFLLLSYPAEHLATVLALQKIVGADLLKIAGILDASQAPPAPPAAELPSPSSVRSTGSGSSHSLATIEKSVDASTMPTPPALATMSEARSTLAHRRRMSFSRADYVLTSSAAEAEIAAVVSALCKVLIDIDAFYTPEPATQPLPVPPSSSSPSYDRGRPSRGLPILVSKFTTPVSPPLSPPYTGGGGNSSDDAATPRSLVSMSFPYSYPPPPPPPPPPLSVREESPSRSSVKSGRGRQKQQQQQQQQYHIAAARARSARGGEDAMSGDAVDIVDEVDFEDAEERRLMPMYMRQSELRKGNSRKALKWLGLA